MITKFFRIILVDILVKVFSYVYVSFRIEDIKNEHHN